MNDMQQELQLYRETLDWVKSKDFKYKDDFVSYYDRYYQIASVHKPIITEDWNDEGVFRYGANGVRGTTGEMLVAFYCMAEQRWKVHQISEQADQEWGSDLRITQGVKEEKISVKTTKPKAMFSDGDLDTRLTLYSRFFKSATWRTQYLALVHPDTKQLWMFNYEALADKVCDVNERGFCKPKFDPYTHLFIKQFEKEYQNCVIYHDMRTFK